jgi:hypothetical protein
VPLKENHQKSVCFPGVGNKLAAVMEALGVNANYLGATFP